MTSTDTAVDVRDVDRLELYAALVVDSRWPLDVIDRVTPRSGWVQLDELDHLMPSALRLLASDIARHAEKREALDLPGVDALFDLVDRLDLLAREVAPPVRDLATLALVPSHPSEIS